MTRPTFDSLTSLVTQVRQVFPTAIIGGGAPRDVFLGGPVKDIDIFVRSDDATFGRLCDELARVLGGTIETSQLYVHAPAYDIQVPGLAQMLNVVQRDCSPIDDVADYDFALSMIYVTPAGMQVTHPFNKDVRDLTITYTHANVDKPDWHRKSSAERLDRILRKYPSFEPVGCEVLEHWRAHTINAQIGVFA